VRRIHPSAWLLVLLSACLQVVIFPLPNLYFLSWIAVAPLLLALLRCRLPDTLQITRSPRLLPAQPWQGFLLGYLCGILWFAGTCYWIYNTMHEYGGLSVFAAVGVQFLFCLYLGLYLGAFGFLMSVVASKSPFRRVNGVTWALLLSPMLWVALELARADISGFPWNLLGITQVDNIPLARIATITGVYGLSFEIMVVNAALAAAFMVKREKRSAMLIAAIAAAFVLQSSVLIQPPPVPANRTAILLQANVPIIEEAWTRPYYDATLQSLVQVSEHPPEKPEEHPDLIVWPESPAPFYNNDPQFRQTISTLAQDAKAWVVVGNIGTSPRPMPGSPIYNSASLVSPSGEWVARYDKVHLVPFGEYVPFKDIFSFAGGLTAQVGDFSSGSSRAPLQADGAKLGVFICYESVFPNDIRQFAANGAQVFINISNDGWYGDSGAYAQHLRQSRMRAVENERWLLLATNTGVTSSVDPYGRIVASLRRKIRSALIAPYALSNVTTFYTRHGDWFAFLCAIISLGALVARFTVGRAESSTSEAHRA
jgi:apolipoprotein N-acyltransferase